MFFLIIVYTLLIFTSMSLDDLLTDEDSKNNANKSLAYMELVILSFF